MVLRFPPFTIALERLGFLSPTPAETDEFGTAEDGQFGEPGFDRLPDYLALTGEVSCARIFRIPRICRHGICGWRVLRSSSRSLTASPIASRRYAVASWTSASSRNASRVRSPVCRSIRSMSSRMSIRLSIGAASGIRKPEPHRPRFGDAGAGGCRCVSSDRPWHREFPACAPAAPPA